MERNMRRLGQLIGAAGFRDATTAFDAHHMTGLPRPGTLQPVCLRSFVSSTNAAAVASLAKVPAASPATAGRVTGLRQLIDVYKKLSKTRLSLLVVSTSAVGFVMGSGEAIDWAGLGWTSLGTFCAAASANTLNQVYEVGNDALMKRTRGRPLPTGAVTRTHALGFAAVMGAAGLTILATKANGLTAALGGANVALYAGVYTPLKVVSHWNTTVGAVVGAIPPLMGWAASYGSLQPGALVLAAGLYFWQLPHFFALAWLCRDDYARGGYKMLPLLDPSGRRVAAAAFRNAVWLFPLGPAALLLGLAGPTFAYCSALATGPLVVYSAAMYSAPSAANARALFRASLLHLPLWMGAMVASRRPQCGGATQTWATLQIGWPATACSSDSGAPPSPSLGAVSVAPFPMLPVPTFAASALAGNRGTAGPVTAIAK